MSDPGVGIYSIATAYPPHCFRQAEIMAKAAEVGGVTAWEGEIVTSEDSADNYCDAPDKFSRGALSFLVI